MERICTTSVKEILGDPTEGYQSIVTAAGNIKCIFDRREDCEHVVRELPKRVVELAPSITVSQAVVCINNTEGDGNIRQAINELERRLATQRNRPMKSMTIGLMATERSRRTGLPAVAVEDGDYIDEGARQKAKAMSDGQTILKLMKKLTRRDVRIREVAMDIKDLAGSNDWIAIIHADGNGVGEIVAKVGDDPQRLHEFSTQLDLSTQKAAQEAYGGISSGDSDKLPVRPVVLSGDDLTVICRADIAVDFAAKYLKAFEEKTKERIEAPLTACAGIAFIKSSYPFHYGYQLAETLFTQAKRDAKSSEMKQNGAAPSCLMFHKVQSSFVEDWAKIAAKELTIEGGSYQFGPYYLDSKMKEKGRWTVEHLRKKVEELTENDEGNVAKSNIRQWLTLMANNPGLAQQKAKREEVISNNKTFKEATTAVERDGVKYYPAYDILALVAVGSK